MGDLAKNAWAAVVATWLEGWACWHASRIERHRVAMARLSDRARSLIVDAGGRVEP